MVSYTKPETRKRMCDRETIISLQQRKWSIVISKDDVENYLGTINMCLFSIPLTMMTCPLIVIVIHLAYGSHSLPKASVTCHSIVLLHDYASHHTPNRTAFYGCTFDRLWISPNLALNVFSLTESLRSIWLASDCSGC